MFNNGDFIIIQNRNYEFCLTVVDRETTYMSRSPSPGVQDASSPPTESERPGRGARRRFPTALGTGGGRGCGFSETGHRESA